MEKYIPIIIVVILIIVVPTAFYFIFKPMINQRKLLNCTVNYDAFMRKFVFCIELGKEEFFARLKTHNANDNLEYYWNNEVSIITFCKYGIKTPYMITVDEHNGYIVLKVEQIQGVTGKSNIPYLINVFWINKFDAKPLEYDKYVF